MGKDKRLKKKKYQAFAKDRFTGKQVHVGYYATEAEARAAIRAKQAELDAAFEAMPEFQAALEATEGLPASPDDIAEAVSGKTYRHQAHLTKFVPYAAVVQRNAGEQQGSEWKPACAHVDPETGKWCGHIAFAAKKGEPPRFCHSHGGKCPHGMHWVTCRECNPNAAKGTQNCGACAKRIGGKRPISKGGTGYCVD
ncbi:hypothetical protein N9S81_00470, partial [bacterium]|nr:hypothetical protein [bacterium]